MEPCPEVEIRKLQHTDEAEICARMMVNSEPWVTLGQDYIAWLEIVTDPSREVYLAFVDHKITGFIILHLQGIFNGYIQSVCVAPKWRNKGIGSRLMTFAERRILSETRNVFICVSTFNQDARRLYERLGYEIIGEPEDSEILLRKTITLKQEDHQNLSDGEDHGS
ncbi:MAG TPA: GNAT family N-acetyltransferase [Thermodesulfobacteriota bacterium]|nr:GNAT family N-acetyltransferase [Thermodesulfobacteriota bacterium]